ncbi:hypothetical protein [Dankookia sp. GCM10030260]|uniref:hypothetical protein n=1 Tax=Dankookia sp. GCM10030260 TaxID=3273390 RepID=UPI0036D300DB
MLGVTLPSLVAVALVIMANGGDFAYGMDGPYIHMAMADQIRQGNYGLNPGEPASPSSSILYPFLLALLTPLPFGAATSLVFCLAANAGSAVLLCLIATECGIRLRAVAPGYLAAMAAALSLGLNLVGLAMGGLEHAPQVTFSLAALLGLVRVCHRERADAWWIAALVLLPLLRFETGSVTLSCVLVLMALGRWRLAAGIMGLTVLVLGSFFGTMHALGLPALPQSVLDRSMVAGTGAETDWRRLPGRLVWIFYTNLRVNLLSHGGAHILLGVLVAGWGTVIGLGAPVAPFRWTRPLAGFDARDRARIAAVILFSCAGFAHLLAGSLVSISRYEIYVIFLGLGAMLVVFDRPAEALFSRLGPWACAAVCASFLIGGAGYTLRSIDAVKSAQALHATDDQMARFVTEYWRGPVMVTRWGRINWHNPYVVAPMPAPSRAIPESVQIAQAEAEAARRGIGLALLFDGGGTVEPPSWRPVARLAARRIGAGETNFGITLYAVTEADVPRIQAALRDFAPSVPPITLLEMRP